jgi:nucleoside-diphosphate-sugar epimerase
LILSPFYRFDFFDSVQSMNNQRPEILLLGCGYTLTLLAKKLSPGTFVAVVSTVKSSQRLTGLSEHIQVCNLETLESLKNLLQKYPSIHTIIDSTPPAAHDPTLIARNVVEASKGSDVESIIYLSSTGVYAAKEAALVDESSPLTDSYEKGLNRIAAEKTYQDSWLKTISLRIAAIYGYERGIGKALKKLEFPKMGPLDRYTNRIHVEDLAEIIFRICQIPPQTALPKYLNCCDDLPVTVENLLRYYAQILQFNPDQLSLLLKTQSEAGRRLSNQRVSNKLLKDFLKFEFQYPSYQQGCLTEFL